MACAHIQVSNHSQDEYACMSEVLIAYESVRNVCKQQKYMSFLPAKNAYLRDIERKTL